MIKDAIRVGLRYDSAGQRIDVERGHVRIGRTSHDSKHGQIFWCPDLQFFDREKAEIFTSPMAMIRPVPVVVLIPQWEIDLSALKDQLAILEEGQKPKDAVAAFKKARTEFFKAQCKEALEQLKLEADYFQSGYESAEAGESLPPQSNPFFAAGWVAFPKVVADVKPPAAAAAPEVPAAPANTPPVVASSPPEPVVQPEQQGDTRPPDTFLEEMRDEVHKAYLHSTKDGKSIRLNEFAKELSLSPEELRAIITSDTRFEAIPAPGWLSLKEEVATK